MVLDTSAIVAVLCAEDEREIFLRLIETGPILLMSAVTLHEASIVLATKKANVLAAHLVDEFIDDLAVDVVAVDRGLALAAREAYFRFGRGYHPARLNLADCFSYGLAKAYNEPLLFKGEDFLKTDIVAVWRP